MIILCFCVNAFAVLPPYIYKQREEESEIKAIAKVKSVKIIDREPRKGRVYKKVEFELVEPLTVKNIPEVFTGHCYSVVKNKRPMTSGTIYYYPIKGMKAYVSISSDGGYITNYYSLTDSQEQKLIEKFQKGTLLMGQVRIKDMPDFSLLDSRHIYDYLIDGEPAGTLSIRHSPDLYQNFRYNFKLESGDRQNLLVTTGYTDNANLRLADHSVYDRDNEKTLIDASFLYDPDDSVPEGIIKAKEGSRITTPLPENTVTDFMIFDIVKILPFDKNTVLKLNILESCEMHLKKGCTLVYWGTDNGYHVFSQLNKNEDISARYWLDETHQLKQVTWDTDKKFLLRSE